VIGWLGWWVACGHDATCAAWTMPLWQSWQQLLQQQLLFCVRVCVKCGSKHAEADEAADVPTSAAQT
jgi:hypothetical protein